MPGRSRSKTPITRTPIAAEEPAKHLGKEPEHFKDEGPEPTVAHFGHFFGSIHSREAYWEDAAAGHHAAACFAH
ncbi:MAG TPA: hypothetical protein VN924_01490 [Bryobacteraceae bacterium]|jgi:hypothetical protein|nr:hypothetical protein [Bryobacteraceae bacterium]